MCGISGADPGAVPGASTTYYGGETGSTHIVKVQSFIRHGIRRYRANLINAKTNTARREKAANENFIPEVERAA